MYKSVTRRLRWLSILLNISYLVKHILCAFTWSILKALSWPLHIISLGSGSAPVSLGAWTCQVFRTQPIPFLVAIQFFDAIGQNADRASHNASWVHWWANGAQGIGTIADCNCCCGNCGCHCWSCWGYWGAWRECEFQSVGSTACKKQTNKQKKF